VFVTLWKLELTSKNASDQLRRLRRRLEAREESAAPPPQPVSTTVPARTVSG
jgi:hypothetical protein